MADTDPKNRLGIFPQIRIPTSTMSVTKSLRFPIRNR